MSCQYLSKFTSLQRDTLPGRLDGIYVQSLGNNGDNCLYDVSTYCGGYGTTKEYKTQVQLTKEESSNLRARKLSPVTSTTHADNFPYDCQRTCVLNTWDEVKEAKVTCTPNTRKDPKRTQYLAALNKSHPCVLQSASNPNNESCVRQGIKYTINKNYGYCDGQNCDDNILERNKGTVYATFLNNNGQVQVTADNGYVQKTHVMPEKYNDVLRDLAVTQTDMDTCKKNKNCETQNYELKYKGREYVVQCSNTAKSSRPPQAFACVGWIPPT